MESVEGIEKKSKWNSESFTCITSEGLVDTQILFFTLSPVFVKLHGKR